MDYDSGSEYEYEYEPSIPSMTASYSSAQYESCSCDHCMRRCRCYNPQVTIKSTPTFTPNNIGYTPPAPAFKPVDTSLQSRCDTLQTKADAICAPGPSGDLGRFNGAEALGQGLSCLAAQKQADIACKK